MILCITGGPGTGKTFLANLLAAETGAAVLHTDDVIAEVEHLPKPLRWSAASLLVAQRMVAATGDLIVEGVVVPRAIRKVHDLSPVRACEKLIVLYDVRPERGVQSDRLAAMAKGVHTVLDEIWGELVRRGVEIEERGTRPARAVEAPSVRRARA